MLTYTLDDVISAMMSDEETAIRSAEARNTINFQRTSSPAYDPSISELTRIQAVQCAIIGRDVHLRYREQLERLAREEIRNEENRRRRKPRRTLERTLRCVMDQWQRARNFSLPSRAWYSRPSGMGFRAKPYARFWPLRPKCKNTKRKGPDQWRSFVTQTLT